MKRNTPSPASIKTPPVTAFFLKILGILLVICVFISLLIQVSTAKAVLFGGLIAIFSHAYFAFYAFRYRGAQQAQKIWKSFAQGESGRFAIVAVGFCLIFVANPEIEVLPLFLSFIGFYFATLFLGSRSLV